MINSLFREEDAQLFTHHPQPIKDAPFSLILSKKVEKNKQLLELFNRGLKRLRESGKVDQYLADLYRGEYDRK
jgi:polar amino acid transport system substrate-binding protein